MSLDSYGATQKGNDDTGNDLVYFGETVGTVERLGAKQEEAEAERHLVRVEKGTFCIYLALAGNYFTMKGQ